MRVPATLLDAARFAWRLSWPLAGLVCAFTAIQLTVLVCQAVPEPPSASMFAMAVLSAMMAVLFFRTLRRVGKASWQTKRTAGLAALPCLFFTFLLFDRIDGHGWQVWPTSVLLSVMAWCSWLIVIGSMPLVLGKLAEQ